MGAALFFVINSKKELSQNFEYKRTDNKVAVKKGFFLFSGEYSTFVVDLKI